MLGVIILLKNKVISIQVLRTVLRTVIFFFDRYLFLLIFDLLSFSFDLWSVIFFFYLYIFGYITAIDGLWLVDYQSMTCFLWLVLWLIALVCALVPGLCANSSLHLGFLKSNLRPLALFTHMSWLQLDSPRLSYACILSLISLDQIDSGLCVTKE